jgi:hypothetical protein
MNTKQRLEAGSKVSGMLPLIRIMTRFLTFICLLFVVIVVNAISAQADAIDGQWCLGASHFEIIGSNIRTPAGTHVTGNYNRHGFTYVIPANEGGAGTQIVMVLVNEETVHLARGNSSPETWKRCKPVS